MSEYDDGFGGSPNRIPQAAIDAERRSWVEYDKKCADDYIARLTRERDDLLGVATRRSHEATVYAEQRDAALAEVERLRAALRWVADHDGDTCEHPGTCYSEVQDIARAALEGKP